MIDDRALLDTIPSFHSYARMLGQAPLAILVCGDVERELSPGYWVQDCSAATQNLLLAARAVGLGAVWLGIHPREERVAGMRQLCGLPPTIMPLALIAIGDPAVDQARVDRYDETRVHRNRW